MTHSRRNLSDVLATLVLAFTMIFTLPQVWGQDEPSTTGLTDQRLDELFSELAHPSFIHRDAALHELLPHSGETPDRIAEALRADDARLVASAVTLLGRMSRTDDPRLRQVALQLLSNQLHGDESPQSASTHAAVLRIWREAVRQTIVWCKSIGATATQDVQGAIVAVEARTRTFGDTQLADVVQFPTLRQLDLRNSSVTDQGVAQLVDADQLEELNLSDTTVTAESVEAIKSLQGLKKLVLFRTRLGDDRRALREIKTALPGCEILP